ncbi:MAG: hypothetical protein ACKVOF_03495 [Pseudohongiellaceae bacterium]
MRDWLTFLLVIAGFAPLMFVLAAEPTVTNEDQATFDAAATEGTQLPVLSASDAQIAEDMLTAEAAAGANDAATTAVTTTPSNSNEDFVPTIQISEDLSVSFPVDI